MFRNQVKVGAVLSYIQMTLSIIVGLVYTPLMIRFLGQSEYGLYNTIAATISSLSILSLGFNSGYIKYYSKYKSISDGDGIDRLNGLFLALFSFIGLVAFACGIFLAFNLKIVFSSGLTESEYRIAKILMLVLTINISISFPATVFTNIISAHEEFIFLKLVRMLIDVVSPMVVIPLLYWGIKSIGIVIVTTTIAMIADTFYVWFVLKKLRCKFRFRGMEKSLLFEIFSFSIFIAINIIVDQINSNIDKILLGRYRGASDVAIYAVGYSLSSYFSMFSTSISGVFTPRIHNIINTTRDNALLMKERITELFIKVGRIQFSILALILTGLIFFGKSFIVNVWAGDNYQNSYYVMLLLVIPSFVPLIENTGIEIQRAMNIHQFRSIIYMIMTVLNVMVSIPLCKKYGAIGSAIGTFFAVIIANGIIMNIFYHKKCHINMINFWKNIINMSKGVIIPILVGICIYNFISLTNRMYLLVWIIVYSIVYCLSIYVFSLNDYEKMLLKRIIKIFERHM